VPEQAKALAQKEMEPLARQQGLGQPRVRAEAQARE
jgi:hypothetical protein